MTTVAMGRNPTLATRAVMRTGRRRTRAVTRAATLVAVRLLYYEKGAW